MAKGFKTGLAAGILGSALAATAAAFGYKKTVIAPQEKAEEEYEEVSRQAVRRSKAAHQSRF
ncbi:DUF3042 family protein [Fructobacillus fructosus]|uniref:DUF3042 family protein n=1 Tax=Fructobacillus fructosus TaxID=1631 RepID=A0ABN9YI01_9LACO|nr:DUF3042 family protein [Fructobacillus fructosus]MBD9364313.1 DUF3042 family protein [Leuconostoc mesenteroides]MBC9118093.1 DUF3042 family protein [Fructobacillus fructosus]MCK8638270.1 DUF3042 family protein [Fructobacillus fructosus]CAK1222681.1 hypothetical protein R54839_PPFHFPJH_00004 [Fructobacillus fructosus]CAK1223553.1 hypothetical protein R55210_AODCCCNP_00004 [Fructobacillus fructosus]